MSKKIHFGTYTVSQHMRNAWDRIEQDPDTDMQTVMDMTHRADLHNEQAMRDWEHQQMVARMQSKLAQFRAAK